MGKSKMPIRTILRETTENEKKGHRSSKKPAFQLYPGDWKKDPGVQCLDLEHKGAWIELMLTMHESENIGRLIINGRPMPINGIANILAVSEEKAQKIIDKILELGVASKDPKTGIIYSRRMIRDQKLSQIRRVSGSLGGNPALLQIKKRKALEDLLNLTPIPTTSTSSSSSTSSILITDIKQSVINNPQTPLTPERLFEIWEENKGPLPTAIIKEYEKVTELVEAFNKIGKANGIGPEEKWAEFVRTLGSTTHHTNRHYMSPVWLAKDLGRINSVLAGTYQHDFGRSQYDERSEARKRKNRGGSGGYPGKDGKELGGTSGTSFTITPAKMRKVPGRGSDLEPGKDQVPDLLVPRDPESGKTD